MAPGAGGGSNWSPTSYDASKGVVYVAGLHMPFTYRLETTPAKDGNPEVRYSAFEPAKEPQYGLLSAIDLKNGGKIVWQHKTPEILVGGVLASKGGLVFMGEGNGDFSAFEATSGKKLWTFHCGAGVNAPPISYAIGGKQYVAVAAGGSSIWGFRRAMPWSSLACRTDRTDSAAARWPRTRARRGDSAFEDAGLAAFANVEPRRAGSLFRCAGATVCRGACQRCSRTLQAVARQSLKDCEQDDVASFAVRACTHLLNGEGLEAAERARVHMLRGKAWLTEDDPEFGGRRLHADALKLAPGNTEALRGRVKAYDLLGKFDLAVADWTRLIAQIIHTTISSTATAAPAIWAQELRRGHRRLRQAPSRSTRRVLMPISAAPSFTRPWASVTRRSRSSRWLSKATPLIFQSTGSARAWLTVGARSNWRSTTTLRS